MKNSKQIITEIKENGGLDMGHIERTARLDGVSVSEYLREWIKSIYNVHGNVANRVADYFY